MKETTAQLATNDRFHIFFPPFVNLTCSASAPAGRIESRATLRLKRLTFFLKFFSSCVLVFRSICVFEDIWKRRRAGLWLARARQATYFKAEGEVAGRERKRIKIQRRDQEKGWESSRGRFVRKMSKRVSGSEVTKKRSGPAR